MSGHTHRMPLSGSQHDQLRTQTVLITFEKTGLKCCPCTDDVHHLYRLCQLAWVNKDILCILISSFFEVISFCSVLCSKMKMQHAALRKDILCLPKCVSCYGYGTMQSILLPKIKYWHCYTSRFAWLMTALIWILKHMQLQSENKHLKAEVKMIHSNANSMRNSLLKFLYYATCTYDCTVYMWLQNREPPPISHEQTFGLVLSWELWDKWTLC